MGVYPPKLTGRSSAAQTPDAFMCVLSHFCLGPGPWRAWRAMGCILLYFDLYYAIDFEINPHFCKPIFRSEKDTYLCLVYISSVCMRINSFQGYMY